MKLSVAAGSLVLITLLTTNTSADLLNLSSRGVVGTGDDVMIAGCDWRDALASGSDTRAWSVIERSTVFRAGHSRQPSVADLLWPVAHS